MVRRRDASQKNQSRRIRQMCIVTQQHSSSTAGRRWLASVTSMQRSGNRKSAQSGVLTGSEHAKREPSSLRDGWYPIEPSNNAHPVTPPGFLPSRQKSNAHGPDALGLGKAVDPLRLFSRETKSDDKKKKKKQCDAPTAASTGMRRLGAPDSAQPAVGRGVQSSPRHMKLQQKQRQAALAPGASGDVAEAFSPQRSLRLTSLRPAGHSKTLQATAATIVSEDATLPGTAAPLDLPLHELVQTVDDADPNVTSNQAAITRLFMAQWLHQFDANRQQYKSFAVHAEVGFQELYRLTANLSFPNEFVTAFTWKILEHLAPHFGPYAPLLQVLRSELHVATYSCAFSPPLPYFAVVKNQKRLVLARRRDKKHRRARNEFLAQEIRKVHHMFRHFLDACSRGLVRTLLREWYSIAITRKKNSKKYIEYFSAWFTGSVKALVPKLFAMWKHDTVQRKVEKMQQQLTIDGDKLANLQQQIEELTTQRDLAQLESLAIRNDRKQTEDMIQRLNRKIQSAGSYLEGSYRREGIVCQEGQLRVEAASFLPPLVLESLLRGYHSVGFLQQLHSEFIPKPADVSAAATTADPARTGSAVASSPVGKPITPLSCPRSISYAPATPGKSTVLQECLAEIIKLRATLLPSAQSRPPERTKNNNTCRPTTFMGAAGAPSAAAASSSPTREISVHEFAKLFCSMRQRIEETNVNVVFTKPASVSTIPHTAFPTFNGDAAQRGEEGYREQHREFAHEIANLYEQIICAIRAQDEHYARHAKLFSSRMLESHEVSVVPTLQVQRAPANGDEPNGSAVALQSGDLGIINGAKRFSIANTCPVTMTAINLQQHALKTAVVAPKAIVSAGASGKPNVPSNAALEQLAFIKCDDFSISARHTRSFVMLFLAHLASEYGSLLFSPADMSAFMHNAYMQDPLALPPRGMKGAAVQSSVRSPSPSSSQETDQGFRNIVTAYEVWNRLAAQMIEAEIVQSRGGFALAAEDDAARESVSDGKQRVQTPHTPRRGSHVIEGSRRGSNPFLSSALPIRPKLLYHIEPLPQGVLMTSAKEKDHTTSSNHLGATRMSLTLGETFHSARIRKLSSDDATKLTECIENVHTVMQISSMRLQDFNVVRQQIRDFRHLQWEQANELAEQFAGAFSSLEATATATTSAVSAVFTSSHLDDERKHVFECISFDNPVLERIFSVEDNPSEELERVRSILERKKQSVRHLYTKHRPQIQHAVSLDDLWHIVKVLRFPKDIHMLPAMRDEDMVANGFEQVLSPDDLAEILLQLCNEQFLPQVTPISARVEYFVTHHLPLASQNQSIIRELMHQPDVKRALTDHSQTIRIIFRRYCAKERDIGLVVAAAPTSSSPSSSSKSNSHHPHHRPRHTGHGITKYMRLVDWLAFIQDYNLLRPRFTLDYAVAVFRNVQEAGSGLDDQLLEMIYSEFCEALVGVAACFFPDPFLKSATKVNQFIQRFLPVSPEVAVG